MSEKTTNTPQKPDYAQKRAQAFMEDYGKLVEKHGIDLASYPVLVPDGTPEGGFKIIMQSTPVDVQNSPKKSPFVAGK